MVEVICDICGRTFLAGNRSALYCGPECRRAVKRKRYWEQRPKKKGPEESFRGPKKSLSEVAREARAAGMDYGDYVALHKL